MNERKMKIKNWVVKYNFLRDNVGSISSTLNVRIFRTNIILAAFLRFFYECTYVKKAAETTFVQKMRAFNVDEIDTL